MQMHAVTASAEPLRRADELLGELEAGLQLLAGGLVVDQMAQCRGEIEAAERKQLAGELVAGERELFVCDQQPPCDRGQRRAILLTGRLDIATLENQSGQAEPATGLGELALSGRGEATLLDIAARAPKDAVVVQDAAEAQRPLDVVIAGEQSLPERTCTGRVHIDVFPDAPRPGRLPTTMRSRSLIVVRWARTVEPVSATASAPRASARRRIVSVTCR
jgi:hypothetical protein